MHKTNEIMVEFDAISQNEALARLIVAGFAAQLNPTIEEIDDIKTAISEAVTNAIIHGYEEREGKVHLNARYKDRELSFEVIDYGCGIEDIEKAKEPMYTTKGEIERSGMGFSFMEAFMDSVEIETELGKGTTIKMKKYIQNS